ncbi:hypothetical protein WJX74_005894 [Apatococcus lobatus]|uniref:Uncharacterized protein n=1 Tax=Apatococcus lobatus TaxID=904363 RepID=A0AAW1RI79_9CHLO
MTEHIQAAIKEAERVSKKQKTCNTKTNDSLSNLLDELTAAKHRIASEGSSEAVLRDLNKRLGQLNTVHTISEQTKDLHSTVNKLSKAIDKAFVPDICKASKGKRFDEAVLNQVIAEHFFHEGQFEVGQTFVEEARIPDGTSLQEPYQEMHQVLKEISARNLQPALEWTTQHQTELTKHGFGDELGFRLRELKFLSILSSQGHQAALGYARQHFQAFKSSQMPAIQRLMGCLCYIKRPDSSPYADLMAPSRWNAVAQDFARQCCGLLGQATLSPLLVTVAAGTMALPTLLKLASVLSTQGQDLQSMENAVELDLGEEFVFRSVFACPVSREQSTKENPPMMLPCGHMLCKHSVVKIAKSSSRSFKCPYCPVEASIGTCKEIHFLDAT